MNATEKMESILGLARGFSASRVLLCGAELDLFTFLAKSPMTAEETASAKNADLHGITILLDALCALGFISKKNGRYKTEPSVVSFLSADAPDSILPMVLHSATLWKTWSGLTDVVLGKTIPKLEKTGALAKDHITSFIGAMHVVGSRMAPEVVTAVNPGKARNLLDVGGGSGTYTLAFLAQVPEMKATLFDLPRVIEMAQARIQEAGMTNRVTLVPGDFYTDSLPPGSDLALLSAIIHQNSPEQNLMLYQEIYKALDKGGRIIIRDHVMSEDRTKPIEGAMFAVNMLVGTPGGGTYTFDEIQNGLTAAGFVRINLIRTKGMFSLVEGFKP